ncbi:hypothetical protein C3L33_09359, partial [Rhododendron williamsianum]
MDLPLPAEYFGNLIQTVRGKASAGELLEHGFRWAVWQLHEAVAGHCDAAVREWVAVAVRSGYANKFDGKVTSYQGHEGGGSMDLEVCLPPETMAVLESDGEFMGASCCCHRRRGCGGSVVYNSSFAFRPDNRGDGPEGFDCASSGFKLLVHDWGQSFAEEECYENMEMEEAKSPWGNLMIWSSPRFEMYGNEFGMGRAVVVQSGYANKFNGKVTLYPAHEGGGSMDLEVSLPPETMAGLKSHGEFMGAVSSY